MHSTYSDGAYSPGDLVEKAQAVGLDVISITDHDSVSGIEQATRASNGKGVTIVPGIELYTTLSDHEVHILGYFIDPSEPRLLEALSVFRRDRLRRAERIIERLNKLKISITMESVLANAGDGSIGRPHIAKAMTDDGYVDNYLQAFTRYIGDYGPAYEKKMVTPPEETMRIIENAGGIAVLAHPGKFVSDSEILELVKAGLDGIEVVHPSHSPELVQHYRGIVNEFCLVETGGSDFHGGLKGDDYAFGQIFIPAELVETMKTRLPHQ
jgi:hypothetical protein